MTAIIRIISACLCFCFALTVEVRPQEAEEYVSLYKAGSYAKALEVIQKKLDAFYLTRVDDKRIPTGFITEREPSKEIDLTMIFRMRKAESFFIEDNPEVSSLHWYAGRCLFQQSNYLHSLNHYVQCLRFKHLAPKQDDVIFYEMALIYKKLNHVNGYLSALQEASSLNPDNYAYSHELGTFLYTSPHKKLAIHHLERYANGSDAPIPPSIYLMLGNLYEDIGRYLETEKYYLKYLEAKPDDGYIHFALAHTAIVHTGNLALAQRSLDRALQLLPESETFRRSKAFEYKADIALKNLEFEQAVRFYTATIDYQTRVRTEIEAKQNEITALNDTIRKMKSRLLQEENFDAYQEYETLLDHRGRKEAELRAIQNEYNKLNAGRIRWNIAYALERLERYADAIPYYREAIAFDYQANEARKKIINLELKIKRGY